MAFALVGCVTAQEQQQIAAAVGQCQSEKTLPEWMRCLNEPETRIARARDAVDGVRAPAQAATPAAPTNPRDVFYRLEPHPQAPKLAPDTNGLILATRRSLRDGVCAARVRRRSSHPRRGAAADIGELNCITVPVARPLWKDVPSWFLVAEDDRMIVPDTQRYMAERMKAKIKAHAVDHTPASPLQRSWWTLFRDAIRSVTGN